MKLYPETFNSETEMVIFYTEGYKRYKFEHEKDRINPYELLMKLFKIL